MANEFSLFYLIMIGGAKRRKVRIIHRLPVRLNKPDFFISKSSIPEIINLLS